MTTRGDTEYHNVVDNSGNENSIEEPGEKKWDGTHPVRGHHSGAKKYHPSADHSEREAHRGDLSRRVARSEASTSRPVQIPVGALSYRLFEVREVSYITEFG